MMFWFESDLLKPCERSSLLVVNERWGNEVWREPRSRCWKGPLVAREVVLEVDILGHAPAFEYRHLSNSKRQELKEAWPLAGQEILEAAD